MVFKYELKEKEMKKTMEKTMKRIGNMKGIVVMLLGAAMSFAASAAEVCLVITRTDASEVRFALSVSPKITYSGGELVVNESAWYTFAIDDVKNYTFKESTPTRVEEENGSKVTLRRDGDVLVVSGLEKDAVVTVMSMAGNVVAKAHANAEGVAVIDLGGAGAGVYALNAGELKVKVIKQ